jgi:23S rRNA pseudouridine1911/1915/1917 synthase
MDARNPDDQTQPLLHWVLKRFVDTPRARAKQWIQTGRVSIGGVTHRKPHELLADPGESLQLIGRQAPSLACANGWQIHPRVSLLFLDSSLAIVNKGPGLLSVPGPGDHLSALSILTDVLAGRLKPRTSAPDRGTLPPAVRKLQPLPVHRLDEYTSGIFCLAMNPIARSKLIEQLRAHTITREYVAFVEGHPPAKKGTWKDWLQLDPDGFRQQIVSPRARNRPAEKPTGSRMNLHASKGESADAPDTRVSSAAQEAVTHYEVLEEYRLSGGREVFSKLRLRLETGLKHQIRIQAAHAGLPLIGDRTYHPRYRHPGNSDILLPFDRQALHSEVLTLEHPEQPGERRTWRADLPADLKQLEAALRSGRI